MSEWSWAKVREQAIDEFNDEAPRGETEQAIVEVFKLRPRDVVAAIKEVGEQVRAGKARSGWAVLRSRVCNHAPTADVRATDTRERDKAVAAAERWIKNTGCHFDREAEVLDALFGPYDFSAGMFGGIGLRHYDDDLLRQRMAKLWREQRPRGEQVEEEELARAERWKAPLPSKETPPLIHAAKP